MKKLLAIVCFAIASVVEANAQSMLNVRVADNSPINVWLDGRYFNKRGTSVTVGDLPYGSHMLRIYALMEGRWGKMYEKIIYHGRINTYEGMTTAFFYDPNTGETQIRQQEMTAPDGNRTQQTAPEGSMMPDNPPPGRYMDRPIEPGRENTYDNNEQSSPVASPVSHETTGTLTEGKMDKLKAKVAGKKVDIEKMNTLKEALNEETFTADQVSSMMDLFGFESSKVEFAEWAYSKTVDKEMYSDLAAKLTYQNYRDELEKFLQAQK